MQLALLSNSATPDLFGLGWSRLSNTLTKLLVQAHLAELFVAFGLGYLSQSGHFRNRSGFLLQGCSGIILLPKTVQKPAVTKKLLKIEVYIRIPKNSIA
jgi:hypothetical protein